MLYEAFWDVTVISILAESRVCFPVIDLWLKKTLLKPSQKDVRAVLPPRKPVYLPLEV